MPFIVEHGRNSLGGALALAAGAMTGIRAAEDRQRKQAEAQLEAELMRERLSALRDQAAREQEMYDLAREQQRAAQKANAWQMQARQMIESGQQVPVPIPVLGSPSPLGVKAGVDYQNLLTPDVFAAFEQMSPDAQQVFMRDLRSQQDELQRDAELERLNARIQAYAMPEEQGGLGLDPEYLVPLQEALGKKNASPRELAGIFAGIKQKALQARRLETAKSKAGSAIAAARSAIMDGSLPFAVDSPEAERLDKLFAELIDVTDPADAELIAAQVGDVARGETATRDRQLEQAREEGRQEAMAMLQAQSQPSQAPQQAAGPRRWDSLGGQTLEGWIGQGGAGASPAGPQGVPAPSPSGPQQGVAPQQAPLTADTKTIAQQMAMAAELGGADAIAQALSRYELRPEQERELEGAFRKEMQAQRAAQIKREIEEGTGIQDFLLPGQVSRAKGAAKAAGMAVAAGVQAAGGALRRNMIDPGVFKKVVSKPGMMEKAVDAYVRANGQLPEGKDALMAWAEESGWTQRQFRRMHAEQREQPVRSLETGEVAKPSAQEPEWVRRVKDRRRREDIRAYVKARGEYPTSEAALRRWLESQG